MIKIEDISVRLGMRSGKYLVWPTKKGALWRVLEGRALAYLGPTLRAGCLDQNMVCGNACRYSCTDSDVRAGATSSEWNSECPQIAAPPPLRPEITAQTEVDKSRFITHDTRRGPAVSGNRNHKTTEALP